MPVSIDKKTRVKEIFFKNCILFPIKHNLNSINKIQKDGMTEYLPPTVSFTPPIVTNIEQTKNKYIKLIRSKFNLKFFFFT